MAIRKATKRILRIFFMSHQKFGIKITINKLVILTLLFKKLEAFYLLLRGATGQRCNGINLNEAVPKAITCLPPHEGGKDKYLIIRISPLGD
jgi:hypothetical protein